MDALTKQQRLIILIAIIVVLIPLVYLLSQKPASTTPVVNISGNATVTVLIGNESTPGETPSDNSLYESAVSNLNISACDRITNAEIKSACISVVQSGIDFRNSLKED